MQNIIGTLLTVGQFLNDEDTNITINTFRNPNEEIYMLDKGRSYIIPDYQREIRWGEKQLNDLIHDIMDSKQFLGNVILSRRGNNYEIIDGQQRITVLRMLIRFIYLTHPFPEYLPEYSLCPLVIDSFSKYNEFESNHFSLSFIGVDDVLKTDDYDQAKRYNALWEKIEQSDLLQGAENKSQFIKKLFSANLNVIINNDTSASFEVEYFIDVNQKGVQLDVEDTLKGYLFQIGSPMIKKLWVQIKKKCYALGDSIKCDNVLLLVFEQYYYCELYKDANFAKIQFKQDFTLSTNFVHPTTSRKYLRDTHLVQVICHNRDIVADLNNILSVLTVIHNTVSNKNYSSDFKKLINKDVFCGKDKLEDQGLSCIYSLLRQILLDTNDVPKILATKYIIDLLLNDSVASCQVDDTNRKELKRKYQTIFPLYALYTLFSLSATKKQRDRLYDSMKGNDWETKISTTIDWFLSKESVLRSKYTFAYKTYTKEQSDDAYADALRCKSIALLYNFLSFDDQNKRYTFKNHEKLYRFLADIDQYSLEHFLLNQGLKCTMIDEQQSICKYPANVKKYIGSCFNFIFINSKINGPILNNKCLPGKIQILTKNGPEYDKLTPQQKHALETYPITCDYSQMIIDLLKTQAFFEIYQKKSELTPEELKQYMESSYSEEYFVFVDVIIERFYCHLNRLK